MIGPGEAIQAEDFVRSPTGSTVESAESSADQVITSLGRNYCITEIDCGELLSDGTRIFSKYVEFFEKEVEVFTAVEDPAKQTLVRPSLLATYVECHPSRVSCFLLWFG
jgi:hypothetical protein